MALSTTIQMRILGTQTKAFDALATFTGSPDVSANITMADGTGANQSDLMYFELAETIAASGNDQYDLAGALTDAYGDAVVFAKIKAILIKNTATNAEIQVGGGTDGAGTNAWAPWITSTTADKSEAVKIEPNNGAFMMIAPNTGWTVTAGTADILRITNNSGSNEASYQMIIIGTSA